MSKLASGAMMATIGILSALLERAQTGKGKHVDISLTEAAMILAVPTLSHTLADPNADLAAGKGLLDGGIVNYNVYKTRDGRYIAVGALEPHFWAQFCKFKDVNRPDLINSSSHSEVSSLFASKTFSEWISIASVTDCCIEPILSPKEIAEHVQHKDRSVVLTKQDAIYGDDDELKVHSQLVIGPRFSSSSSMFLEPASSLGEDTDDVLRSAQFSADEITTLRSMKAIF